MLIAPAQFSQDCRRFDNKAIATTIIIITIKTIKTITKNKPVQMLIALAKFPQDCRRFSFLATHAASSTKAQTVFADGWMIP